MSNFSVINFLLCKRIGKTMVILAGDISKKETHLALFNYQKDSSGEHYIRGDKIVDKTFINKEYEEVGMSQMIRDFLSEKYPIKKQEDQPIYGGCFAIAGPIENGEARISDGNLFNTTFSEREFKQQLRYPNVPLSFINDMEAYGYGIFRGDREAKLPILYQGKNSEGKDEILQPTDRRALILVSDGLGIALWYCFDEEAKDLKGLRPLSSEGGHIDFASRSDEEKAIFDYIKRTERSQGDDSPVRYEEVLSKNGLIRIYKSLSEPNIDPNLKQADDIIKAAHQKNDFCEKALEIFLNIYGAQTGNIALIYNAKAIYVGGLKIPEETLKNGIFEKAFLNKHGKRREDNAKVTVKIFDMENLALHGAVKYAIDSGFVIRGKFAVMRARS